MIVDWALISIDNMLINNDCNNYNLNISFLDICVRSMNNQTRKTTNIILQLSERLACLGIMVAELGDPWTPSNITTLWYWGVEGVPHYAEGHQRNFFSGLKHRERNSNPTRCKNLSCVRRNGFPFLGKLSKKYLH